MAKRILARAWLAVGLLAAGGAVSGEACAGEIAYSARALEIAPSGIHRNGRLLVRGSASRLEYHHMGMPVIEIEQPDRGVRRVLFPVTRTYLEYSHPQARIDGSKAPCVTTAHQICTKTGREQIGGVETDVWELRTAGRGDVIRLWWSPSHGMIVREEYPDGRRMHGLKREAQPHEGFATEQWEFTYMLPGGRYLGGMAIIARDLDAPVVERRPDGTIRRLVDIKRGSLDAAMFELPPGYRRINLPYPPPPGQTAPSGWQPMPSPMPGAPQGDGPYAARFAPQPPNLSEGATAAR